jgi:hypothetical protein
LKLWKKLLGLAALIGCLACPSRAITPQVTITATSATLLGTTQTISLDCHLIDPNGTGVLRVGTSVITNMDTATVTPGTTATCGPLWGADVITDGFGNTNTTYYLVSVYVVTKGVLASTPSLSQAYQLDGSATYDLSTALPYSLGAVSPAGSVLGQNLTFTGTNNHTGAETFSNIITNLSNGTYTETTPTAGKYFRDNGTSFVPSSILAADIPASTSQCSGVQFAIGINSGDVTNCATPPTFGASGASHAVGYVPDPGSSAGTSRYLREDATWDVVGGGAATTACTASSPVTVSNTVAATALLSCSVPANTLSAGSILEVTLTGIESTATGATMTITLTTNLGGGTSVTTVSGTTGVCNAQPWYAKFYFTTITSGSSGTGNWSGSWQGNACSGSYGGTGGVVGNPTIAINTTIGNTLAVTVTMSTANAGNSVTGQILKSVLF